MIAAPFPYFGGKRRAASLIWAELDGHHIRYCCECGETEPLT